MTRVLTTSAQLAGIAAEPMATRTDAGAPIKLGSITLWPDKYCVAIDGTTKILTAVEFRLLYRLASQPYRTFTPEELYGDAPEEIDGGARKAIRHRVHTVRRGMGRCAGRLQTVRDMGYRLVE